jgi:hypothetical protein
MNAASGGDEQDETLHRAGRGRGPSRKPLGALTFNDAIARAKGDVPGEAKKPPASQQEPRSTMT